jgi:uncharacterized membrane protein YhiD involved in acid resistance
VAWIATAAATAVGSGDWLGGISSTLLVMFCSVNVSHHREDETNNQKNNRIGLTSVIDKKTEWKKKKRENAFQTAI